MHLCVVLQDQEVGGADADEADQEHADPTGHQVHEERGREDAARAVSYALNLVANFAGHAGLRVRRWQISISRPLRL